MGNELDNKSHQNYELLIRLDEQMKSLSRDFREMSGGFERRMAVVENGKLGKDEAVKLLADAQKIHEDHEKRLRAVEESTTQLVTKIKTWGSVAVLALSLLQIFLKFI